VGDGIYRVAFVLIGIVGGIWLLTIASANIVALVSYGETTGPVNLLDLLVGSPVVTASGYELALEPVVAVFFGIIVLLCGLGVAGWLYWRRIRQSDWYFRHQLRTREGLAEPPEIRKFLSRKALMGMAGYIRPTLKNPRPEDVGTRIGVSRGVDVWLSGEESILLLGPSRSGKGQFLVTRDILAWKGPVITTSTRGDNFITTSAARAKMGDVIVFDPEDIIGYTSNVKISPYFGCTDVDTAMRRAQAMVAGTALGNSSNNQEWAELGSKLLASLLLAAALGDVGAETLGQWGASPVSIRPAINILTENGHTSRAGALQNVLEGDPKSRDSTWFGIAAALAPLLSPAVLRSMTLEDGDTWFDPDRFLEGANTLYLIGTTQGSGTSGILLGSIMDAIVATARRKANWRSKTARLEPPLRLTLDEIGNMFPWKTLPEIFAAGAGEGITTLAVFQSVKQMQATWSEAQGAAIWGSATTKIILAGREDVGNLSDVTKLLGTRKDKKRSDTYQETGGKSSQYSSQEQPVMTESEIKRLPRGTGLLLYRNRRGVFVEFTHWTKTPEGVAALKASKEANDKATTDRVRVKNETPTETVTVTVDKTMGVAG